MIVKLQFGDQLRRVRLHELSLEEVEDTFFSLYPAYFTTKMRFVVKPKDFPLPNEYEISKESDFAFVLEQAKAAGKNSIKIHVSVSDDQDEVYGAPRYEKSSKDANDEDSHPPSSSNNDFYSESTHIDRDLEEVPKTSLEEARHNDVLEKQKLTEVQPQPEEPQPEQPQPQQPQPQQPQPQQPQPQQPQQIPTPQILEPPQQFFEAPQQIELPQQIESQEIEPQQQKPEPQQQFIELPHHITEPPQDIIELQQDFIEPPGITIKPTIDVLRPLVIAPQQGVELLPQVIDPPQRIAIDQSHPNPDAELPELNFEDIDDLPPLEQVAFNGDMVHKEDINEQHDGWNCPRCTLENNIDDRQCVVCTMLRPGVVPPPPKQLKDAENSPPPPQVPVGDFKEGDIDAPGADVDSQGSGARVGNPVRFLGNIGRKIVGTIYGHGVEGAENEQKLVEISKNSMNPQPGHFYVQCNICKKEIFGYRYRCYVCEDYNLCAKCDAKIDFDPLLQHNPLHAFIRIKNPAQDPKKGIIAQQKQKLDQHKNVNIEGKENVALDDPQVPIKIDRRVELVSRLGFGGRQKYEPSAKIVVGFTLKNVGFTSLLPGTTLEPCERWNTDKIICPDAVQLPPLMPNDEVEVRMNITTPPHRGTCFSAWRLRSPPSGEHNKERGEFFGKKFDVVIKIESPFTNEQEDKLLQLHEMGFEDRGVNVELMCKQKWRIASVTNILLTKMQSDK